MLKRTYTASSLAQIADEFRAKSTEAEQRSEASKRSRDAELLSVEADTWKRAAELIDATTLIDPLSVH